MHEDICWEGGGGGNHVALSRHSVTCKSLYSVNPFQNVLVTFAQPISWTFFGLVELFLERPHLDLQVVALVTSALHCWAGLPGLPTMQAWGCRRAGSWHWLEVPQTVKTVCV